MKVTVVGAGNVGATCADVLATREIANEIIFGRQPQLTFMILVQLVQPMIIPVQQIQTLLSSPPVCRASQVCLVTTLSRPMQVSLRP